MSTEPHRVLGLRLPVHRWPILLPLGVALLALILTRLPGGAGPAPDPDGLLPGSSSIPLGDTLRLQGIGLGLSTDPQAEPPLFELSGTGLYLPDLDPSRDRRLPAVITRYRLTSDAAAAIIAEAKQAGLRGSIYLPDPDRDAPLQEFRLLLIEGGNETARVTLLGEAQAGERGKDVALRAALWGLIERLRDPQRAFILGPGEPYLATRYVVRAARLPDGEPWTSAAVSWSLLRPGEWGATCRLFAGDDARAAATALGGEPLGRAWRDDQGALWMLSGRPVLPAEPAPCDAKE